MNKEQVKSLLKLLKINYQNAINENNIKDMLETWTTELSQYDYEDIEERLKECMALPEFQMKPPTLYHITSKCKKKHDKIDWENTIYYCDLCHKAFNDYDLMMAHRVRENSIEYIINQTAKIFHRTITVNEIKSLWNLDQDKFDEKYKLLLKYIYEHTNDENEKKIIGYIFNPPNQDVAKKFVEQNSF